MRDLLAEARLSSNPASAGGERTSTWSNADANSPFARQLVRLDPPDHTRLRGARVR